MTDRRQRACLMALAVVLVLARSFPAIYYEGFYFDSDQAIVGLMARHLSRLQTLPLFYYSLNYILGVQAWIIAPFFALGRSSVGLARVPLLLLNIVVALWLLRLFTDRLRLRPVTAFVAALPFLVPTPSISAYLLQFAGASIEPFVYVIALWALRKRPFAFGLLLGVAYLHREFAIFTVPAMLLVEWRMPGFWSMDTARRAGWALAGFALVWLIVDDLKLREQGEGLIGQAQSLKGQMCATVPGVVSRAQALVTEAVPIVYGGYRLPIASFQINSQLDVGYAVVGLLVFAALAMMLIRVALDVWRTRTRALGEGSTREIGARHPGLAGYLAWVGLFTACAYPLSCNVTLHSPPLLRYLLLTLLLPIGLFAAFAQRERSRALCTAATAVFVLWGAANLWDNTRVVVEALRNPPGSEHRALVDYLIDQRIRYARAIYWDAYVVDFLSGERVIAASVDTIRIPAYQKLVDEHAAAAVSLERLPCEGARRIASWCIVGP